MERWQQIESLFQEALQHDAAERDAWLREACRDDSGLRREVSSLLANHQQDTGFEPWAAAAAAQLIGERASLEPGQSLGPYRIESFIAAGGMGEVYRATDTRLHREVAIKVSAARFSDRFEREARVIASLNHPHICQLYDVGPNYLVMELVEGPTLADRIRKGAIPLEEALAIARQIAEALEAAHEKGRIHRDLKPANVKITPEGVVKVLDFGLAKAAEEPAASGNSSDSPTVTVSATGAGVILGTAAYMSPEQARGATVDKRADIWAFGCVLYEMLAGKPAFQGDTTSDILAAVLRAEPDWSRIPARVQPLLRRCLAKDPKHRLRDVGDAMPLLDGVPEPVRVGSQRWPWLVAAVLAIAAAMGWWRATRPAPLRPLVRVSANLSPAVVVDRFGLGNQLALSPDGTRIVVIEGYGDGRRRMVTRQLDESEFGPLPATESAEMPFFSPNGQWIAFFTASDKKLKKMAVQGGSPVTLCDAPNPRGGSWGDDDNIIASLNSGGGLSRIHSGGGAPAAVTGVDREKSQRCTWPQVLPGSQAVLFSSSTGTFGDESIEVLSFKTGERKTVLRGGFFGRYLPSGHLVYMHQSTLFAVPFDLSRLSVTGAVQPVLEDISNRKGGAATANFDFSQTGTFVYVGRQGESPRSIFWLDSAGKTQPLLSGSGRFVMSPRFSPDGKRLAFAMDNGQGVIDVWVQDLERGTTSRLTSLPGVNGWPVWTPDGKNIVFARSVSSPRGLFWIRSDGAGEPQPLTDPSVTQFANSFSPDRKRLAGTQFIADGHLKIWIAPVEGEPDHRRLGKAGPFLHTSFEERDPAFSPDGRWLAYSTNETGTIEVYVQPFPGPGGKTQISTGGGAHPIWSRKGRELFFLTGAGPGALDRRIMVVGYTTNGDSFAAGKPRVWSQKFLANVDGPYDLAPDGERFAVVLNPGGATEELKAIDSVTVLLNFFDELKRRVSVRGQ